MTSTEDAAVVDAAVVVVVVVVASFMKRRSLDSWTKTLKGKGRVELWPHTTLELALLKRECDKGSIIQSRMISYSLIRVGLND